MFSFTPADGKCYSELIKLETLDCEVDGVKERGKKRTNCIMFKLTGIGTAPRFHLTLEGEKEEDGSNVASSSSASSSSTSSTSSLLPSSPPSSMPSVIDFGEVAVCPQTPSQTQTQNPFTSQSFLTNKASSQTNSSSQTVRTVAIVFHNDSEYPLFPTFSIRNTGHISSTSSLFSSASSASASSASSASSFFLHPLSSSSATVAPLSSRRFVVCFSPKEVSQFHTAELTVHIPAAKNVLTYSLRGRAWSAPVFLAADRIVPQAKFANPSKSLFALTTPTLQMNALAGFGVASSENLQSSLSSSGFFASMASAQQIVAEKAKFMNELPNEIVLDFTPSDMYASTSADSQSSNMTLPTEDGTQRAEKRVRYILFGCPLKSSVQVDSSSQPTSSSILSLILRGELQNQPEGEKKKEGSKAEKGEKSEKGEKKASGAGGGSGGSFELTITPPDEEAVRKGFDWSSTKIVFDSNGPSVLNSTGSGKEKEKAKEKEKDKDKDKDKANDNFKAQVTEEIELKLNQKNVYVLPFVFTPPNPESSIYLKGSWLTTYARGTIKGTLPAGDKNESNEFNHSFIVTLKAFFGSAS